MTEKWRLKIVPDASPNASGRWIEIEIAGPSRAPHRTSWRAAALYFNPFVPAGEHLVQYDRA